MSPLCSPGKVRPQNGKPGLENKTIKTSKQKNIKTHQKASRAEPDIGNYNHRLPLFAEMLASPEKKNRVKVTSPQHKQPAPLQNKVIKLKHFMSFQQRKTRFKNYKTKNKETMIIHSEKKHKQTKTRHTESSLLFFLFLSSLQVSLHISIWLWVKTPYPHEPYRKPFRKTSRLVTIPKKVPLVLTHCHMIVFLCLCLS